MSVASAIYLLSAGHPRKWTIIFEAARPGADARANSGKDIKRFMCGA
jgi:hypothetical protein